MLRMLRTELNWVRRDFFRRVGFFSNSEERMPRNKPKAKATVLIVVGSGMVQEITGIPKGMRVVVRDYDVFDSSCPEDEFGKPYQESVWQKGDTDAD